MSNRTLGSGFLRIYLPHSRMGDEGYSIRLQKHSAVDTHTAASARSPAMKTDSLAYNSLRVAGDTILFNHAYTVPVRPTSVMFDDPQNAYSSVYPQSSQPTTTRTVVTRMGSGVGDNNSLSEFASNQVVCEFDAPLQGAVSGNGSLFNQYGIPPSSNASICDHRSPLLLAHSASPETGGSSSAPHLYSHSSTPATERPFYSPLLTSAAHAMTSYPRSTSSSYGTPSQGATFSNDAPNSIFDMAPSSSRLQIHHEKYPQHIFQVSGQQTTEPPPSSIKPSIPMCTPPEVDWDFRGYARPRAHPFSSSSSFGTPILPSRVLCGDTGKPTSNGLTSKPYGPLNGRSPSVAPQLSVSNADHGSSSESNHKATQSLGEVGNREAALLPAPSSHGSSTIRDVGSESEGQPQQQQTPVKKKKKSKMHTCEVCGKQFPRPSGLRTHMNTHNNARPYACGFPGCTRTFGVRSNAKRHLRTHGVIPPPALPNSAVGESAYVVGFSPPVIISTPLSKEPSNLLSDANSFHGAIESGEQASHSGKRGPFFRVRWVPPSLASRINASSLRAVDETTGEVSDDQDDSEDVDEDGFGSDRDDNDHGPSGYGSGCDGPEGDGSAGGSHNSKGGNMFILPSMGGLALPPGSISPGGFPTSSSLTSGTAPLSLNLSGAYSPNGLSSSLTGHSIQGFGFDVNSSTSFATNHFFGPSPTSSHHLLASA